jgi:hypothetical protein
MIQINFDPYDMLINHDVRIKQLEKAIQEIQFNQMEMTRLIQQQNGLIKQLQQNEAVLSEAIGTCLLQQQDLLKKLP